VIPPRFDLCLVGGVPSPSFGKGSRSLAVECTGYPKFSKLAEDNMKAFVFGVISLIIGAIVGFVVMAIESQWSVIAAIVTMIFTFWMLCIFTNTQEGAL
jgi:hypothetical protein